MANDVWELDGVDHRIIEALAENARISLKELASHAGLSSPSCAERLRRLEERGVVKGFTVLIDPAGLGYTLQALVRVRPMPGQLHIVQAMLVDTPEVIECDKVTGDDCFICRLVLRSMSDLDRVLDRISERAETNTSIIKATPVARRLPPLASHS